MNNTTELIWTDDNTKLLQNWIDDGSTSAFGAVIESILEVRRDFERGVKVYVNNEKNQQTIKHFDEFINLVVKKLTAKDYILSELNKDKINNR